MTAACLVLSSTCRLGVRRLAALRRLVFGRLPPNRTYTSPRIRLSISNGTLSFSVNHFVAVLTYDQCLSAPFEHDLLPFSITFESCQVAHLVHQYFAFSPT